MLGVPELRASIRRWAEASCARELVAACARHPDVSPAAHSALEAMEGMFAASLASAAFWIALIALVRCR